MTRLPFARDLWSAIVRDMLRPGLLLCGAVLSIAAAPVRADADTVVTIGTDRPAVTESSVVVPQGAMQVENGLLATDAAGRYVVDFPESDFRYGLLPKTELRLAAPDYFHEPSSSAPGSGFGDTAVGIKQQLGPLAGFDISVVPFVSLPTGARGQSSHGYDPGLQLPWSHGLPDDWTIAGQLASYWPTQGGRHNYTGESTLLFDRQLTAACDAFIEYAGDFPHHGGSSQLLHIGTAYKLAPRHQLDLHAAIGLTSAAPRSYLGLGYSFLLLRP